ncbi:MAG: PTS system mannose/fructose/sorbose family transporter subunit IID [Deltaproteobacteria bacterium]|nr:PTS system mannose/fructose/sorbose family transporter subunit IID [Deltaproteobacteria bacterium]
MNKVRTGDLIRVSMRLTFLQSTWCEGGMQSVGLAYCLMPGLRRIVTDKEELKHAVVSHQEPFNTHPFLVGAIAGATLRLTEDGKNPKEINSFIHNTMGPLAAIGDPFFRGALPVFVAVTASLAAILGGAVAGILTLLLLFNLVQIFVRFFGVFVGYRESMGMLTRVARWLSPTRSKALKTTAAAWAGAVLVFAAAKFGPAEPWWVPIVFAACGIVAAFLLTKWERSRVYVMPVSLALCLIVEVLV